MSPPFSRPSTAQPVINLPPVTKKLILILIGLALVDWMSDRTLTLLFAFRGLDLNPANWLRMVGYGLVHADIMHLAFNILSLAILGQVLERRIGATKMIIGLGVGCIAGAALHVMLADGGLIGISAGTGALFGVALPGAKAGRFGSYSQPIILLCLFLVFSSLLGLILPIFGGIAHIAHLGGFIAGLGLQRIWRV